MIAARGRGVPAAAPNLLPDAAGAVRGASRRTAPQTKFASVTWPMPTFAFVAMAPR